MINHWTERVYSIFGMELSEEHQLEMEDLPARHVWVPDGGT